MAKILLIQPNYDIDSIEKRTPWMPLALVELASFIKEKANHDVRIYDRNLYLDNMKFIAYLKNFNPDIVGTTCYTSPAIKDIKQIAKIVKENSNSLFIVGGVHATLEPKSLLDYKYIDYVVRGEGELALLEICNLVDKKRINNKEIIKIQNVNLNPLRPLINLNELPILNYELLEIRKYPVATFCTSRGCPGRCRFCYNQGKILRYYNTEKTVETMRRVLDKYKIREFTIADDNFANLSKRTEIICNFISKYNPIFHIFLRVDQTHDKVMENLKKAGCWSIQFGFESGSQRILDFINKKTTVEQNANAIKQCKKYGIFVDGSFMVGLPTETIQEVKQTEDFIKINKPDAVDIKIFRPYPSTELYDYCIKNKLIERYTTLDDWIKFGDLKEGEPNVSNIPTHILSNIINKLSKTSYSIYIKKALLLLKNKHTKYVLMKSKIILKNKLGLQHDEQKTRFH